MVVLDATSLLYLLDPNAKPPTDPETGQPVTGVKARVEYLVSTLDKDRQKVIVPTPVLGELLVRAGTAGPEYLEILNRSARFAKGADIPVVRIQDQPLPPEVAQTKRSLQETGEEPEDEGRRVKRPKEHS